MILHFSHFSIQNSPELSFLYMESLYIYSLLGQTRLFCGFSLAASNIAWRPTKRAAIPGWISRAPETGGLRGLKPPQIYIRRGSAPSRLNILTLVQKNKIRKNTTSNLYISSRTTTHRSVGSWFSSIRIIRW